MDRSIAVVGTSCRLPGNANDLTSYWDTLTAAKDCIRKVPPSRWNSDLLSKEGIESVQEGGWIDNVDLFDNDFFEVDEKDAKYFNPIERLSFQCLHHALEDAAIPIKSLRGKRIAVIFASSGEDGYDKLGLVNDGVAAMERVESRPNSGIPERIQQFLGATGYTANIQTACSSAHVAIDQTIQCLLLHQEDIAIVGAANMRFWPDHFVMLASANMASQKGRCATFSTDADGYVPSEGVSFVVLKRLQDTSHDRDRVRGIIRASSVVHTGRNTNLSSPSRQGQARLFKENLTKSGLNPSVISHIETHGTGTPVGDPIEMQAINDVYRSSHTATNKLIVTSGKTIIGHTEEVSGLAGLLKVLLSFQHDQIPPHLHLTKVAPGIDMDAVPIMIPTTLIPYKGQGKARIACINSFGLSGTLSQLIVQEPAAGQSSNEVPEASEAFLLTLSAKSTAALTQMRNKYIDLLSKQDVNYADICYTSNIGRDHFRLRSAFLVKSKQEALKQLQKVTLPMSSLEAPKIIVFMFPGQGSQQVNMGLDMFTLFPVFRETMLRCEEAFCKTMGFSMLEILYPKSTGTLTKYAISDSIIAQPALLAYAISLAALWKSLGVMPTCVIGHSVGEIAAAAVSGALSEEAAIAFICNRGRIMQPEAGSPPAGMAAIVATVPIVMEIIQKSKTSVSISAYNGERAIIVSGYLDDLAIVSRLCEESNARFIKLQVTQAFHSTIIEPSLTPLREYISAHSDDFGASKIDFISTSTGGKLPRYQRLDAGYWTAHARNPVQFVKAIQELDPNSFCIELGADGVLTNLMRRAVPSIKAISCGEKNTPARHAFLGAIAKAYNAGINVDFKELHTGNEKHIADIPSYPFQEKRFWIDPPAQGHTLIKMQLYPHLASQPTQTVA